MSASGAWNPVTDFTVDAATATSANGVWQYGSMTDLTNPASDFGVYSLVTMTWGGVTGFPGYYSTDASTLPMLLCNQTSPPSTIATGSIRVPAGFLEMHPGPDVEYSVLRFVAPTAGVYAVSGTFQGQDTSGTTTDVHIFQVTESTATSSSLFSSSVNGFYGAGGAPSGTSPVVPFDLGGVLLAEGDSLLFAVGFGSVNYYSDSTGLALTVTPVTTFDAGAEFTVDAATGTSANGVWEYGQLPDLASPATSFGVYTLTTLTYDGVAGFSGYYATGGLPMVLGNFASPPATIVDGSVHLPVGFLEMHPGSSGQYSAVRFVAPAAGTYGFAGQFQGQDSGGTSTDVHVLRIAEATSTSTSLFSSNVNGFYGGDGGSPSGTSPIAPFDLSDVALAAGDSVLFVVGDGGGTYYADSTGLAVTASLGATGSPAADDPFGYLGGLGYWQDPALADSGLSYVRQRWLENASGQWLSVDPVASEPRYGYAHNIPSAYVDAGGTSVMGGNRGPGWSFYKWLYTGNGYASNEVYQAALEGAQGELESQIANIHTTKQRLLKHAEKAVRHWAESQTTQNANAFSQVFAGIMPFFSFAHIPDSLLSGMDRWFAGTAAHASRTSSTHFNWLKALLPPTSGSKDEFTYKVGFLWGIFEAAVNYVDLISMVADVLDLALEISKSEDIFALIKEAAHGLVAPILQAKRADRMYPFDRGKLAGTILINLVLLIAAVVGAARLVSSAAGFAKRVAVRFGKSAGGAGFSPKAIEPIGDHLGAHGVTPEGIIDETQRQVNDVADDARIPENRYGRTEEEWDDLAKDPAHKDKPPTVKTKRERDVALALESRGKLKYPIRRDPSGNADFIDGAGQKWDVKGFQTNNPTTNQPLPLGKPGRFNLQTATEAVNGSIFEKGEYVILDMKTDLPRPPIHFSAEDAATLRDAVSRTRQWDGKILFYPD